MAVKTVIDTNVLVSCLSSKSVYHKLITLILQEQIDLFITNEILLEYEEILTVKYSNVVANNFIKALKELPNVFYTQVYYNWHLLKDEDDNKFVDCYVAANAEYLITNDRHFKILENADFPKINLISLENFLAITTSTY